MEIKENINSNFRPLGEKQHQMPGYADIFINDKDEEVKFHSEIEIENIKNEFYEKGKNDGLAEENNKYKNELNSLKMLVLELENQIKKCVENSEKQKSQAISDMLEINLMIAKKICSQLIDNNLEQVITSFIKENLSLLQIKEKIKIIIKSGLNEEILESIKKLTESFKENNLITIEFDETFSPSDCKIIWDDGSITKEDSAIWQKITEIVENFKIA